MTWPVRITSRTPERPAQWGGQAGPWRPGKGTEFYGVLVGEVNGKFVVPSERRVPLIGEGKGPEVLSGCAERI